MDKVRWIQAKTADNNQEQGDQECLSDYSDSVTHDSRGSDDSDEDDESESSSEGANYATNKFAALAEDD